MSNSAGGLIVWPARLMVPIGFFLLVMQGMSELIKRIGFLQRAVPTQPPRKQPPDARGRTRANAIKAQKGEAVMAEFLIATTWRRSSSSRWSSFCSSVSRSLSPSPPTASSSA
jgi:hypothetical protein